MLLRKDPKQEVSIFMGLKGGGDNDVFPWRQPKVTADLSRVHEDLRKAMFPVFHKELFLQMDVLEVLKLYVPWRWVQD